MMKLYVAAQSRLADVKDQLADLRKDESGAALIEYALIVGLMAVVVAGVMATFSTNMTTAFNTIGGHLTSLK